MIEQEKISMDDFDEKFTMYTAEESENFEVGTGMFETYGNDMDIVNKMRRNNPYQVWTAVDGDSNSLVYLQGYHLVNRIYYLITNEDGFEGEFYQT